MRMRHLCIVKSCANHTIEVKGVDFFYLPVEKKKANAWLTVVKRNDLMDAEAKYEYHRVCARHFSEKQFSTNHKFSRPRLVTHAIPDKNILTQLPVMKKYVKRDDIVTANKEVSKKLVKAPPPGKLKQDQRQPVQQLLQLKELQTDASLQNNVVRLKLPPGVSVAEFASSDAMKNITSKLSGMINKSGSTGTAKKTFVVKLQTPTDGSNASASAGLSTVSVSSSLTTSSSGGKSSTATTTTTTPVKKVSFITVNEHSSSKRACSDEDSAGPSSATRIKVKKMRVVTKPAAAATGSASTIDLDNSPPVATAVRNTVSKQQTPQETGTSTAGSLHYYDYQRELISRQAQRIKLLDKIRRQKELLVSRGNELCKYRLQLNKIRQKNNERNEMTLAECLKVLKGNMHEHALELLYTQLVGQDQPMAHGSAAQADGDSQQKQQQTSSVSDDTEALTVATDSDGNIIASASSSQEQNADTVVGATEEIVYTPRVLESALLFSVAGKKAYKAMGQSLKLPPYSEIVKWKKIIRSDPPFYKKHFPNLRAKFFKRRKPDGKTKTKKVAQNDGFDWPRTEETGKKQDYVGKSDENSKISLEETNYLYRKLLAEKETFENLFVEDQAAHTSSKQDEEDDDDDLPELGTEDEEIDFNIDAAEFIKRLKQREKEKLYGQDAAAPTEWEQELEQLNAMEEDAIEKQVIGDEAEGNDLSSSNNPNKSVNETISRVINSVVQSSSSFNSDVAGSCEAGPSNTLLTSTGNVVTVLNEHHHQDDNTLPDIEHSEMGSHDALFMVEDAIIAQTTSGENVAISYISNKSDGAGASGIKSDAGPGYVSSNVNLQPQTLTYSLASHSVSPGVSIAAGVTGPHQQRVQQQPTTVAQNKTFICNVPRKSAEYSSSNANASDESSSDDDSTTPGPSMPRIF